MIGRSLHRARCSDPRTAAAARRATRYSPDCPSRNCCTASACCATAANETIGGRKDGLDDPKPRRRQSGVRTNLLFAGHDTTAANAALGVTLLLTNPSQRDQFVANPDKVPDAVEELIRFSAGILPNSGANIPRLATKDIERAQRSDQPGQSGRPDQPGGVDSSTTPGQPTSGAGRPLPQVSLGVSGSPPVSLPVTVGPISLPVPLPTLPVQLPSSLPVSVPRSLPVSLPAQLPTIKIRLP
jgi:hypothetical protein